MVGGIRVYQNLELDVGRCEQRKEVEIIENNDNDAGDAYAVRTGAGRASDCHGPKSLRKHLPMRPKGGVGRKEVQVPPTSSN